MKFLLNKYKKLHPLYKFVATGLIIIAVWFIFYHFFRNSRFIHSFYEIVTQNLTTSLLSISQVFLNLFGFETEVFGKVVRISGTSGVYLDRGCLGRNLMGLFAGFILAYPGRIKHKIWYVPLGLVVITFLNVLRIAGLAYVVYCCPEYLDVNHHVIFKYTVYFFIFLMWYFWIKNYSVSAKPKKKKAKLLSQKESIQSNT